MLHRDHNSRPAAHQIHCNQPLQRRQTRRDKTSPAPPGPFTIEPGTIQLAKSPFSLTCTHSEQNKEHISTPQLEELPAKSNSHDLCKRKMKNQTQLHVQRRATSSDHSKRLGRRKQTASRNCSNGFFARVNKVCVFLAFRRIRTAQNQRQNKQKTLPIFLPNSKESVLRLKSDLQISNKVRRESGNSLSRH